MIDTARIDRRSFLVGTAAAGLSLGFRIPPGDALAADVREVNAWVVVQPDDTVVVRIARSEIGQGTMTGLAQLVAEELECDWSKVTTEFVTPGQNAARGRAWGSMMTGGSCGIRTSHDYVRMGGAAARMMLIQAAANGWDVPASECRAANSVITHGPSGRSVSFGQVAAAAAKLEPPRNVPLKDPKDWKIAGTSVKRLDSAGKVDGSTVFSIDIRLPGLLSAAIKDCPVFGGIVKGFDAAAVLGMPGVRKVVPVGASAIAVVADTWWQAKTALDKLPIVWDEGPNATVSQASIEAFVAEGLTAGEAIVGNRAGDVDAALARAAKTIEAVYGYPFQIAACMEPMNATALYTGERCEVWCGTQNSEEALTDVARTAGLPIGRCEVHRGFVGSGFGRKGRNDEVAQAVLIAKQVPNTPVKLIWSREEDIQHGGHHPITQCRLIGGLDAAGNLTALHMRIAGQSIMADAGQLQNGKDPLVFQGLTADDAGSIGFAAIGYSIPNLLIDHAMRNPHVPPGAWRAVNVHQNAIYLECFVDELAHAAGADPLAFRRKLMADHPRNLRVLEAVAERVGWDRPPPHGVSRGLAAFKAYGSYVAACAEISMPGEGKLKIHRIVAAIDSGHVVNPAQIERQIAGSFVFGLSGLVYGGCTVKDGRIEQSNFHDYDSMRLAVMPKVEAIIMPSGDFWGGVGEPTTCIAAPAVLNAIFAATGTRYRTVPLRSHGITMV